MQCCPSCKISWAAQQILLLSLVMACFLDLPAAWAIIVLRDPGRNLTPPRGDLADSGWQDEGDWHGFPGTPIGPHHFLTAAHLGGKPLTLFRFRGCSYLAVSKSVLSDSDIAVWRVAGTFPGWATLYEKFDEVGKPVVLFGRGGARGEPIFRQGRSRGYRWGEPDGRLSWGCSRIAGLSRSFERRSSESLLLFHFAPQETGMGADTAAVSRGDSGGGVFFEGRRNLETGRGDR